MSFLARLTKAANPVSSERTTYMFQDPEIAVLYHLKNMLNTRKGSCLTCPDYGLIDFSDLFHDFPNAIQGIQKSIKDTISKYEPRLKNVNVIPIHEKVMDSLILKFEITAQIVNSDGTKLNIKLGAEMDHAGNFSVKK